VSVTPVSTTAELVQQKVYFTSKNNKKHLLKYVLETEKIDHVLVFTRTKHGADKVAKDLTKAGIKAEAIHGNKSQGARERALNGFKDRTVKVLVATDIASRGIDVDKLSHVINFDIPEVAETYVHRIGRTGRAGSSGEAISFCMEDELPYWKGILKLTRQDIEVVKDHPYTENISVDMPTVNVPKSQHSNGNGASKKPGTKNNRWRGKRSFGGKREGQKKA
jgi:ATP-dependent RNA helicase RhlE